MNISKTNHGIFTLLCVILTGVALTSGCGSGEEISKSDFPANIVETTNGPVRGLTVDEQVHVFKGVRYGAPPVGALRFKPPTRPAPWTEPAVAYEYGNRAMQGSGLSEGSDNLPGISEDCLFLNVWTPGLDDKKRPVMVWLHGGGFSAGSGSDSFCDGKNLARKGDVVVITINHRLNVFGFLQLSEAWGPDYTSSGQAGMLDIVMSLEWVRDNVALFGGDPGNVTIFGESGGGRKVAMMMAMKPAAGLFHKAIIQSGSGLDAPSKADSVALGRELLQNLGIADGDIDALVSTGARAFLDAQPSTPRSPGAPPGQLTLPVGGFVPCVDGIALERKPFIPDAPMISAGIPLMIGSNKDEMAIFRSSNPEFGTQTEEEFVAYVREVLPDKADVMIQALHSAFPDYSPSDLIVATDTIKGYWVATVLQAERKAAQGAAPVYVYQLAWETRSDNGRLRAHHALDVPLVFDNVENTRSMVGPGPETWPAYNMKTRATMVFDIVSHVVQDPYQEIRRILLQ
ncbi:MAG: carboxylesterase family protein [Acidobacteriota bacterium]